jgi:hypothetical protein
LGLKFLNIIICTINIIIFIIIKSIDIKNIIIYLIINIIHIKNTIICIINIIIFIIVKLINIIRKKILLILKNKNRFHLKGKIKNYYYYF